MPVAHELTAQILQAALRAGALGAEVHLTEEEDVTWATMPVQRVRGVPGIVRHEDRRAAASLRFYGDGGRCGLATIVAPRSDALSDRIGELIQHAATAAADAAPDPVAGPPDKMDIAGRGLSICDPRRTRLSDEDREDILSWHWGAARSVSTRIRPRSFALEERFCTRHYASSRGVQASEQSTRYQCTGTLTSSARGDERVVSGQVVSRSFADIASQPLGTELGNRLEAGERTTQMPDGPLPLVLEPHIVANILALLPPAFDSKRLAAGTSCLRDQFGSRIAPSGLHLVDDASEVGGLHTRSFDARGTPSVPVPLMRDGVPSGVYLSPEAARRRDTRATGHCGPDNTLWPGNLILRPGNRTRNMLFADLGRYLNAIHTIQPPTLDIASGRMVLDVWLLHDGVNRNPAKIGAYRIETSLSAFLSSVQLIASDQSRHRGVIACTVVTEGLPLAAL